MDHSMYGRSVAQTFGESALAALARSACMGDGAGIAAAIAAGADPNGRAPDGASPLIWAVDCQNAAGVEALLRAGADPNYQWAGHFSATFLAATRASSDLLELLLRSGGDPNRPASNGDTPLVGALMLGISEDYWDNYYALLRSGADIDHVDDMGWTIANNAAALGRFDKVEELLGMGYRGDLTDLGRTMQARAMPDGPAQADARRRVRALLVERGVRFPIPPPEPKPAAQ